MTNRAVLETISGEFIDLFDPRPEQIKITDVAQGLSFISRFAGQTAFFWSVAAHSLLVAQIARDLDPREPTLHYAALMHDAAEYLLGDVPTPTKEALGDRYRYLTAKVDAAIGEAFGIDPALFRHPTVKRADAMALRAEAAVLKHTSGDDPRWSRAWAPGCDDPDPRYIPREPSYPSQSMREFIAADAALGLRLVTVA